MTEDRDWSGRHHHHYPPQEHNQWTVVHHNHLIPKFPDAPGLHNHNLPEYRPCEDDSCPHRKLDDERTKQARDPEPTGT